jgi:hypothetical protein
MSIPCPFVYAKGKRCPGHVVRVEAFKADLSWSLGDGGRWTFHHGEPRSHYHVFCSEKGNHVASSRPDSDQMKFFWQDLPEQIRNIVK